MTLLLDSDKPADKSALHFFVDEAGDPVLFDGKGRILVGSDGCSRTFIVGKLDVADPAALQTALEDLRADLLTDPFQARALDAAATRQDSGGLSRQGRCRRRSQRRGLQKRSPPDRERLNRERAGGDGIGG